MKVLFLTSVSTAAQTFGPGQLAELPDGLAGQWVRAGYCQIAENPTLPEPAAPQVEAAPVAPAPTRKAPRRASKVDDSPL